MRDRAQGTRRIYELDFAGITAVRHYLDRFWDDALDRFAAAVTDPDDIDDIKE